MQVYDQMIFWTNCGYKSSIKKKQHLNSFYVTYKQSISLSPATSERRPSVLVSGANGSPCHPSRLSSAGGLRRPGGEQHGRWHPGVHHWEAAASLAGLRRRLGHQPEVLLGVAGRQPLVLQQTGAVAPPKPSGQPQLPEGEGRRRNRLGFFFGGGLQNCVTWHDVFFLFLGGWGQVQ